MLVGMPVRERDHMTIPVKERVNMAAGKTGKVCALYLVKCFRSLLEFIGVGVKLTWRLQNTTPLVDTS